ncbi:MAG: hypothetical protein NTV70_14430 [Acidobacteria bacterium]|nr:hypothetical protein [Acidobacteriota bacterium]
MQLASALLYVKDLARLTAFYQSLLGTAPVKEAAGWVEFDAGRATLMLHEIPGAVADQIVITTPPEPRDQTPLKLIFAVPDLAAERARLAAVGIDLVERPWGSCDGMDPEGNIFTITG